MSLPVAEPWFARRELDGGITLLTEPHVHSFLLANMWHVRGRERSLLFDTGLGISSIREFAPDLLDGPLVAVASHAHYDHIGGLHEFGARAAHTLDAGAIREPGFASLVVSDFPDEFSDEMGGATDLLITAVPSTGFDPAAYAVQACEPTTLLEDGDTIDLGDRAFAVLHLPGHTPGSIALWEEATGILLSGDVVYDGRLLDELPESDVGDYVASLERLREVPVSIVHPGHYGTFGRERLLELIEGYLRERG
jgi:glyoxylase-like metal-dependent hydrolase (beta-lactamase superfamily II)